MQRAQTLRTNFEMTARIDYQTYRKYDYKTQFVKMTQTARIDYQT